jgi:D-aspartate ligase
MERRVWILGNLPMTASPEFLPVLLGTGLGAYNMARQVHEAFGVKSLALGRARLRETSGSDIVEVLVPEKFDTESAIVTELLELGKRLTQERPDRKLLLVPLIEFYSNVVIANQQALGQYYLIPLPAAPLAEQLMNKTDFYATCARLGVPHPVTVVVNPDQADDKELGENLPFAYPVILKPSNTDIYPRLQFAGRQKVYLLETPTQVRDIAKRIFAAGYDDDLLIQEYLSGDESVMKVANTYSNKTGKMQFCTVGQVVLTEYNPTLVGNNNAIVPIEDPALTESLRTLLDSIGYIGAANADVMVDRETGEAKILELNLRPGATAYYTAAGGNNLARAYVEDLVFDQPVTPDAKPKAALWLNLPYCAAKFFAPPTTRNLLKGRRRKARHTLRYAPDMSLRRRLNIARLNLDRMLDYAKYSKQRLNA